MKKMIFFQDMRGPLIPVLFFLIFGIGTTGTVGSDNYHYVVPLSSPLYQYMDTIYMEAGLALPNTSRPWTGHEVRMLLDGVQRSELSDSGLRAYDYISDSLPVGQEQKLVDTGDSLRFRLDLGLTTEFFTRYNFGNNLNTSDAASDVDKEQYDWVHGFEERKPFLEIPIEFIFEDTLYMYSGFFAKEEHATVNARKKKDGTYPNGVTDNRFNVLFDDPNVRIDIYFPFRSYASTGGEHWNFRLGRGEFSWGNGETGNMMLSDYSDFYDYLSFSLYGDRVKLSNVYILMDPLTPLDDNNNDKPDSEEADTDSEPWEAYGFVGHRFDFRITDRILFSVSESITVQNRANYLISDLNYLMVYHNRLLKDANSLLTLELSVNPWKYMSVYGQFAMDEYRVKYEAEGDGGGGPPIFGFLGGIEGAIPFREGYLSSRLEGAYTNPLIYNRDPDKKGPPYYYNVRKYYSVTTDRNEYIVKPIGYRYGPDSIVAYFEGEYNVPGGLSSALSFTYLMQGENQYLSDLDPDFEEKWDTSFNLNDVPTGTAEKRLILSLSAEYPFSSRLTAGAGVNYSSIKNLQNKRGIQRKDIELTTFVTIKPEK